LRGACAISALACAILIVTIPPAHSAYVTLPAQKPFLNSNSQNYSNLRRADQCTLLSDNRSTEPQVLRCTLAPSDDTFADDLAPTKSFGDLPVLIVQDTPSIPKYRSYAYLKFDLPRSLPQYLVLIHAMAANATLRMHVRLVNFGYNASIRVYRVPSNDWNESTLTWVNRPAPDPADFSVKQVTMNGTMVGWNVTRPVDLAMRANEPVSLAVIPSSNDWRNFAWFDSKEHPQSNITTWPTLDIVFVEPFLTLVTEHAGLPITIGNQTYVTDSNGRFGSYLPWGTYQISVPGTIPRSEGVRDAFVSWSDDLNKSTRMITLGSNLTLGANYETQYRLDADSDHATINGSGWYYENSVARLVVYPTAVPAEGLLGLIGVRHVFDHWSGDCISTQPECVLVMNSPKRVFAVWKVDYAITVIACAVLIAIASVATLVRRRYSRIRGRSPARRKRTLSVCLVLW
jgi:hypothetical protein